MSWTPDQMPDLTGRTAVVTGANSGIGLHTALELGRHGARVVMACRNVDAAESVADELRADGAKDVEVRRLDLSSLTSVREFAESWAGPLDLLVNNAGVMAPPTHRTTEDGHELQFGTNHLGHFALTGQLLPALLATDSARVVTVSSIAHRTGSRAVLEGNPREGYRPPIAYAQTKFANLLFAEELQRRAAAHGTSLTSTAAHPGVAVTGLASDPDGLGRIPGVKLLAPIVGRILFQSAAAGAVATLYAATVAAPGSYTGPQSLRESRGPVGPAKRNRLADDLDLAARLWAISESKTGVEFDWPTA